MVKGTNITLEIDKKKILNNVSFEIPKGKITAFIGPSGAGKTSLLKCVANLYSHYTGTLLFQGVPIRELSDKERAHSIGFIFQQFNLFPHMTVLQNCCKPLQLLYKLSSHDAEAKALRVLESLGMGMFKDAYPAKLSGGQQQRVAIARALCLEPQLLLFDEPSSALDPQSTKMLATLMVELCKNGVTIALSSHDMNLVSDIADNVYYLEDGCLEHKESV